MDRNQAWIQAELQWTEPLRQQKKKRTRKAALLTLLPFLGGAVVVPFAMWPFLSDPAEGLAYGVLFLALGLFFILLVFPFLATQTTRGYCLRRLNRSVKRLRLTPEEQNALARDLLEALNDPRRHFDCTDGNRYPMPLHFVLGRRWAYLSGGWNYTPCILPLAGVRGFSPGQQVAVVGRETIRLYFIWFDGLPKKDGFTFHDPQSRDRALAMLQAQTAGLL